MKNPSVSKSKKRQLLRASLTTFLEDAASRAEGAQSNLRAAYQSAVALGDEFAVIHLMELITHATDLERRVKAAAAASAQTTPRL